MKLKSNDRVSVDAQIDNYIKLIALLDGYRVDRYVDVETISKLIEEGRLGRKVKAWWKNCRVVLEDMAELPRSLPKVVKLCKARVIAQFVGSSYLAIGLLIIVAHFLLRFSLGPILGSVFFISALFMIPGTAILTRLIDREIGLEIERYFKNNPNKFRGQRRYLKKVVQDLIRNLSKLVRQRQEKTDSYFIDLYNVDYEGIEVVEGPSRLRKSYIVKLKMKR